MLKISKNVSSNGLNEFTITVPDNITYIEDWGSDFGYIDDIMSLDKGLCGCGFTRWALNNSVPTILLSPRRVLLENKEEQHNSLKHPELRPVYYFRNSEEEKEKPIEYDKEINAELLALIRKEALEASRILSKEEIQEREHLKEEARLKRQEHVRNMKMRLMNYLKCGPDELKGWDFVPKIMVTYDSFHYVLEAIGDMISQFVVVVDEYQCMFQDSTFKSEVELNTLDLLRTSVPRICFVSATPMIDKYLEKIDFFKSIPIYRLDWGDRINSVNIQRIYTPSLLKSIKGEIEKYKSGEGVPTKVERNFETGEVRTFVSEEAVFFVNSVTLICDVIRSAMLLPEEVNILCSDTGLNNDRLKRLGKRVSSAYGLKKKDQQLVYEIGKLPDRDEPHKKFTFCTRTVYLGADFYSKSAMTYVCGDLNVKTLVIDIALDLPQIVGRQRLMENRFRDELIYFFKSKNKKKTEITKPEFDNHMTFKMGDTKNILSSLVNLNKDQYSALVSVLHKHVSAYGYADNFVGVVRHLDGSYEAVLNELVLVSEMRAYEIARPEYQENIVIASERDKISSGSRYNVQEIGSRESNLEIFKEFTKNFKAAPFVVNQLKVFCDFVKDHEDVFLYYHNKLSFVPLKLRNYMNLLGPNRISALKYQESDILRELNNMRGSDDIAVMVYERFIIGEKYTRSFIKSEFSKIYEELNLSIPPKGTDIDKYFNYTSAKITLPNGNRINAIKLTSRK